MDSRHAVVMLTWISILALPGCSNWTVKKETARLEKQCDVVWGTAIDEDQARCVARLYGVQDKMRCPMTVDQPDGYGQEVFRIRESCNSLGVVVARSTGRVLELITGDRPTVEESAP